MKLLRTLISTSLVAVAASSMAQAWARAYDGGLKAAASGKWAVARASFKEAASYVTEDKATPTNLGGSPTDPRRWRNGAPYSPNFLAAYSAYRQGLGVSDADAQRGLFTTAASELESLLAKGKQSREAYFFLELIYTKLGDSAKHQDLANRLAANTSKATFKVDDEVVAPEELAALNAGTISTAQTNNNVVEASSLATYSPSATVAGPVAVVNTKFALVIGQARAKFEGGAIPFAAESARVVADSLVNYAGYASTNVRLINNASAAEIKATADALAQKVTEGSVVTLYFVGTGVNVLGKDYIAGIDAESATDTNGMVAKSELFSQFSRKGARIFSFFESSRPVAQGSYFGSEDLVPGAVSQEQATIPGGQATSILSHGKEVGLFSASFSAVLAELRSNHIPITEFGWQVFYYMRRGGTGLAGGSSRQVPTLPVLSQLAADSRF